MRLCLPKRVTEIPFDWRKCFSEGGRFEVGAKTRTACPAEVNEAEMRRLPARQCRVYTFQLGAQFSWQINVK